MISRRGALGGLGLLAMPGMARAIGVAQLSYAGALVQGGWLRGQAPPSVTRLGYLPVAVEGGVGFATPGVVPVPLAPDGAFFVGLDRDSGAHGTLVEHDGRDQTRDLAIAPRAWRIETIDAPFHPPAVPDDTFARIRAGELARIEAARAQMTGAPGWRQTFIWPARGRISGRFGSQRIYRGTPGAYHSGLDIAPGAGATYVAPADGVVVLAAAAPFTLEGNLLMIDHGMGLNSAFLHAQRLLVREGDRVVQGQPLGVVGMTGRATGPHLHWSLRWREARLDPLLILPGAGAA